MALGHRSDWRFNAPAIRGAEPVEDDGELFVDVPFITSDGVKRVIRVSQSDAGWLASYMAIMVRKMNGENA